jgi:hypothetical protein
LKKAIPPANFRTSNAVAPFPFFPFPAHDPVTAPIEKLSAALSSFYNIGSVLILILLIIVNAVLMIRITITKPDLETTMLSDEAGSGIKASAAGQKFPWRVNAKPLTCVQLNQSHDHETPFQPADPCRRRFPARRHHECPGRCHQCAGGQG